MSISIAAMQPAGSSDWVEDNQTNFRIKPPKPAANLAPGHSSDMEDFDKEDASRVKKPQAHDAQNIIPYDYNSDHAAKKSGSHPDLPELEIGPGSTTNSPVHALQGGVSDIEDASEYRRPTEFTMGMTEEADRILLNAPRVPILDARNVGSAVFRSWLEQNHGNLALDPKESIIDVKGQWDDSGHILHSLGLGYNKISANQLIKSNLSKTAVMLIDCAGVLDADALNVVREFVRGGGYLVTTDWALDGVVARITASSGNGYISWNSGYSYPSTVDAVVVDPIPALMKGCVPYARWRLDDKCQTVHIRNPFRVHVLVRSNELAKADPDNKGILAATFPFGKGKILHIVGHFDNNSTSAFNTTLPDHEKTMGISLRQGIITNFIVAGLKAHGLGQEVVDKAATANK